MGFEFWKLFCSGFVAIIAISKGKSSGTNSPVFSLNLKKVMLSLRNRSVQPEETTRLILEDYGGKIKVKKARAAINGK